MTTPRDAPPIPPAYLRVWGPLRSQTWPGGPRVSDYVCPHTGCRVGRIYTGPLLRATGQAAPAVLAPRARRRERA